MKIKSMAMGIIIFIIIFGGIGVTMVLNMWATKSDKIPVKIKEGEFEGSYNPADIRGSYSFADVSEIFEIEPSVLYQAFGIWEDTNEDEFQVKELKSLYEDTGFEIGTESLRIFVALYKKLPVELDDAYLPKTATELILQENTILTTVQKEYLEQHTIDLEEVSQSSTITLGEQNTNKEDSELKESENVVNGSVTFQQVLEAGVTKDQIEKILGVPMPPTNQKVKDYCVEAGLAFSDIKNQLNELIEEN